MEYNYIFYFFPLLYGTVYGIIYDILDDLIGVMRMIYEKLPNNESGCFFKYFLFVHCENEEERNQIIRLFINCS